MRFKINSLLGVNKQYGDVAATLAFADKMPGGVTDANINTVKTMKGSGGWDQVAKNLSTKVNVSDVAGKLSSVDDNLRKSIKQAMIDSYMSGKAPEEPVQAAEAADNNAEDLDSMVERPQATAHKTELDRAFPTFRPSTVLSTFVSSGVVTCV